MANRSVRKSQLIAFKNAAAGHDGVLADKAGDFVVKPCKDSEIKFYESAQLHPDFVYYIPRYWGTLSLADTKPVHVAGARVLPADTSPEMPSEATFGGNDAVAWTPSNGGKIQTDLAIILDNVALHYEKPNILDVKLGARLWADDAPEAKRARLDKAAEETTSKPLGFRIAGAKTYQGPVSAKQEGLTPDGYKLFDKNYGRSFKVDTVRQGFEDYFRLNPGSKAKGSLRLVIRRFIEDLRGLAEAIENEESRMYSASLLFVYEGDAEVLANAFVREKEVLQALKDRQDSRDDDPTDEVDDDDQQEGSDTSEPETKFPAIQSLKLIDFAHAQWTPGQGPDENILHGIRNVTKILGEIAG